MTGWARAVRFDYPAAGSNAAAGSIRQVGAKAVTIYIALPEGSDPDWRDASRGCREAEWHGGQRNWYRG